MPRGRSRSGQGAWRSGESSRRSCRSRPLHTVPVQRDLLRYCSHPDGDAAVSSCSLRTVRAESTIIWLARTVLVQMPLALDGGRVFLRGGKSSKTVA
ncbi:hypothetical protein NXW09_29400 [Bacteroides ovatus]|nr:hypothetical protein [Bacteroides ovatus]